MRVLLLGQAGLVLVPVLGDWELFAGALLSCALLATEAGKAGGRRGGDCCLFVGFAPAFASRQITLRFRTG